MSKPKYYLTTPVYNGASEPPAGSLYTAVLCDAIAQHKRMCGFDVAHFTGVDNEARDGKKTSDRAEGGEFPHLLNLVGVRGTFSWSRGSVEQVLAVETLLRRVMRHSRLAIYKNPYQGRYCAHDQVDVSGSAEAADCPICGRAAVLISEERHFFRLSAYQDRLAALYKYHPGFVQPHFRLEESRNAVTKGLKDIPISRGAARGGISWPDDPDHTVCAWFAELASYMSAVGFGKTGDGSDEFRRYWPPNLHVIDPGRLASHAVYWPALLMAADLPLPRHIFAHGNVYLEEEGKATPAFSEASLESLGSDAVRYGLLREVRYGEDARAGRDQLVARYNADLAQGLGNLAHRIHGLVARHCDGKIPNRSLFSGLDPAVEITFGDMRAEVRFLLDRFHFSEALEKIGAFAARIDKLLNEHAECEAAVDNRGKNRYSDVLHDACEGLGWMTLLLHPILPRATDAIWSSLGETTRLEDQLIDETPWSCLMPGTPLGKLEELFPVIDVAQNTPTTSQESKDRFHASA